MSISGKETINHEQGTDKDQVRAQENNAGGHKKDSTKVRNQRNGSFYHIQTRRQSSGINLQEFRN
jgi:hypothetical protein